MLLNAVVDAVRTLLVIPLDPFSIFVHTCSLTAFLPDSGTCISLLKACSLLLAPAILVQKRAGGAPVGSP